MDFKEFLNEWGLHLDIGIIVVIIIITELSKVELRKKNPHHWLLPLLPGLLAMPAVFFLSQEVDYSATGFEIFRALGGQWLMYVAGAFIGYKWIWKNFEKMIGHNKN